MIYPNILREKHLNNILSFVETTIHDGLPTSLEVVGDAGTGKTTLLNQLKEYLEYCGIFPQVIYVTASVDFSMQDSLHDYAHRHGLGELLTNNHTDSSSIRNIHDLLTSIRDPRKDILIYAVDDAHILSKETIDQINLVFNPEYSSGKRILILSGRKTNKLNNRISLSTFSEAEFDEYISATLSKSWKNNYPDGYDWLWRISGNNPYQLYLLLEHCSQKGLMTADYSAPLELLESTKFPDNILDAVGEKYNISDLTDRHQLVLKILAVNPSHGTTKEISKIIGLSPDLVRRDIKTLRDFGWLVNTDNRHYKLYHPLVKELILKSISKDELNQLHWLCLNFCGVTDAEKAQHALYLEKPKKAEQDILFQHAGELEKQGLFYSAIQIYEKLKSKDKHGKVIVCACMRKLIHIVVGVLKNQTPFNPNIGEISLAA